MNALLTKLLLSDGFMSTYLERPLLVVRYPPPA